MKNDILDKQLLCAIEESDMELCNTLKPIFDLEIEHGNEVEYIDSPAGSKCPYSVTFKHRLHYEVIEKKLNLSPSVERWENKDRHYPIQGGYKCTKYNHSISGPL